MLLLAKQSHHEDDLVGFLKNCVSKVKNELSVLEYMFYLLKNKMKSRLDINLAKKWEWKLLNCVLAARPLNDTHTLSCWPEKGVGLGLVSIARGVLHPHLLAHGRRWKKMASQTGQPLSLLCFLCSRFTVGSNESHQQLFACSIAAPW